MKSIDVEAKKDEASQISLLKVVQKALSGPKSAKKSTQLLNTVSDIIEECRSKKNESAASR